MQWNILGKDRVQPQALLNTVIEFHKMRANYPLAEGMLTSQENFANCLHLVAIKTDLIPVCLLFIYSGHNLCPAVSVLGTGMATFLPST